MSQPSRKIPNPFRKNLNTPEISHPLPTLPENFSTPPPRKFLNPPPPPAQKFLSRSLENFSTPPPENLLNPRKFINPPPKIYQSIPHPPECLDSNPKISQPPLNFLNHTKMLNVSFNAILLFYNQFIFILFMMPYYIALQSTLICE